MLRMKSLVHMSERIPNRKVFVSFDYYNDESYKELIELWEANASFDFYFSGYSAATIDAAALEASTNWRVSSGVMSLFGFGLVIGNARAQRRSPDFRRVVWWVFVVS